jgi:hypothetical protein
LPDILGKHGCLVVLLTFSAQWGARVYMLRQQNLQEMKMRKQAMKQAENKAYEDRVVHQTGGNGGLPATL